MSISIKIHKRDQDGNESVIKFDLDELNFDSNIVTDSDLFNHPLPDGFADGPYNDAVYLSSYLDNLMKANLLDHCSLNFYDERYIDNGGISKFKVRSIDCDCSDVFLHNSITLDSLCLKNNSKVLYAVQINKRWPIHVGVKHLKIDNCRIKNMPNLTILNSGEIRMLDSELTALSLTYGLNVVFDVLRSTLNVRGGLHDL